MATANTSAPSQDPAGVPDLKQLISRLYAEGFGVIQLTHIHDYVYEAPVDLTSSEASSGVLHREWASFLDSVAQANFAGRLIRYEPSIGLRCHGETCRANQDTAQRPRIPIEQLLSQTARGMLPEDSARDPQGLPLELQESCAVIFEALRSLSEPVLVSINVDIQASARGSSHPVAESLAQLLGHVSEILRFGHAGGETACDSHLVLLEYRGVAEPLFSGNDLGAPIGELRQPAAPLTALELLLGERAGLVEGGADSVRLFAQLGKGASLRRLDMALNAAQSTGIPLSRESMFKLKEQGILERTAGCLRPVQTTKKLSSIAGYANARALLRRIVEQYRNDPLNRDNVRGVLLAGPPGTGKTHLAEAVSVESGLPFFQFGNFRDSLMGESERRLSLILDVLKEQGPAVIFIDEADSEFPRPGQTFYGNNTEASLVNRIKHFIGNPDLSTGILVIMATNYPQQMDPAIVRAGRIGLSIPMLSPNVIERSEIVELLAGELGLVLSGQLRGELVAGTEDYSGADLRSLLLSLRDEQQSYGANEEQLRAFARLCKPSVSRQDMIEMSKQAIAMVSTPRALPWFNPATLQLDPALLPCWLVESAGPGSRSQRQVAPPPPNGQAGQIPSTEAPEPAATENGEQQSKMGRQLK